MHTQQRPITTVASDADLLQAAVRNESDALLTLYDRYASTVCGVAMRVLREHDAAEDAVRAAFLDLWKHAEAVLTAKISIAGWLVLAVRAYALALLQGQDPGFVTGAFCLKYAASVEGDATALTQRAHEAMDDLAPPVRKILQIAFFDGMEPDEIAIATGTKTETVKAGIRTGLLTLRRTAQT